MEFINKNVCFFTVFKCKCFTVFFTVFNLISLLFVLFEYLFKQNNLKMSPQGAPSGFAVTLFRHIIA